MTLRRLVVAAVAAGVAALAAVGLLSLRNDDGGNPVLDGARTTAGDGSVLHVIARERIAAGRRYDIETGRTRTVTAVYESWVDAERGRVHTVQRSGGEVVSDEIVDMAGLGPAQSTATLAADFRRRLDERELRLARTGTIGGRKVHWLVSTADRAGVPPFEAAVDAETYRLVRIQTIGRYFQTTRDFELLRSVPRDEADFVIRFAAPTAVRQTRPEGRSLDPSAAADTLAGAQWADERVGDLRLRGIRASDWRAELRARDEANRVVLASGVILTVAYGERIGKVIDPAAGTPTGVEIAQAAEDSPARHFLVPAGLPSAPPPAGTFDVSGESGPSGQFVVAILRKPGVWIRVRAPSRKLLFQTVRTLRPLS